MSETAGPPLRRPAGWLALVLLYGCATAAPPMSAWQQGQQQLRTGHITEARRAFERELHMHPDNLQARYNLALLLHDLGHANEAARLYQENLNIGWHFPTAINLAQYLRAQKKTDAAEKLLHETARRSAHEATPWYLLGDIADEQGRPELAGDYYRRALLADPANGYAHLRLAMFQSRRAIDDRGISEGRKALRLLPECAPCWRDYGDILARSGAREQALAAYQRSLAIQPDVDTRRRLIELWRAAGETEKANRLQRALDIWISQHADAG